MRIKRNLVFLTLLLTAAAATHQPAAGADTSAERRAAQLREQSTVAARGGSPADAIRLAGEAIEVEPNNAENYTLRARLLSAGGQHEKAVEDYDRAVKLDPRRADALEQRGSQHFMLGNIDASIRDFDRQIELQPDQEPWHWKRGISYYYAGRYDEGQRQFEGYQTVDDNDVENAVWRFLCMARRDGVQAARRDLLKIKRDPRVPMMTVYALFAGEATPDDVLAAARAGSPTPDQLNTRLFYAHLYLGLYHEVAGDARLAKMHLNTAATEHKIGHYMWNVADVHVRRLDDPAAQ